MRRLVRTIGIWLLLMAAPWVTVLAVNSAMGRAPHTYEPDRCTRYCHDHGCPHVQSRYDFENDAIARAALDAYAVNIRALGSGRLSYAHTNLVVYVAGFPTIAGLLLLGALWPVRSKPVNRRDAA